MSEDFKQWRLALSSEYPNIFANNIENIADVRVDGNKIYVKLKDLSRIGKINADYHLDVVTVEPRNAEWIEVPELERLN